jgi:glycosyltransferase involved in cell wall biosynthesis
LTQGTPDVNFQRDSQDTVASLAGRLPKKAPAALAGVKTRLLIVSPQPFYQDRGTPIAVSQLAAALSALGYEVDLLAYPIGTPMQLPGLRILRGQNPFGIRQVRIGFSLKKIVLDAGMLLPLVWLLHTRDYGVVHVLEELAWPVLALCRRRKIPVIYDMQSSLPDQLRTHRLFRLGWVQRVLRAFEDWALRRSNAVICSAGLLIHVKSRSPQVPAYEWKFPGLPRDASDRRTQLRASLGIGADRRVVMYAGTLEPYQGIDMFLQALATVSASAPSVVGVLVGSTPENDLDGHSLASRLVVEGKLQVLPRQPRDAMPAYLAMADVLVSPRAYGDNIPLKIFDYVLSGKPIVATDIPAHRSILDERTALLVECSDIGLAAGIQRLIANPELGARISQEALSMASAAPGKQAYIGLVESLYASTLEPGKQAPRARRARFR